MSARITLTVGDEDLTDWTDVNVSRIYKDFCPTFDFTYLGEQPKKRRMIPKGTPAIVSYGSAPLITGYVNRSGIRINTDYQFRVSGRGKTQDMVDCTAQHKTGQWANRTMEEIANELCAPLKIPVILSEPDDQKFKRFALDEGETYFDAIDRLAKARGYLPSTHPTGALVLLRTDKPGRSVTLPVEDAIERSLDTDDQNRYSDYLLESQTAGDDEYSGDQVATQTGTVKDPGVDRFRPLTVIGNAPAHKKELQAQAEYERNIRIGESTQASYTFPGILAPDNRPWAPGMAVRVRDPQLFTDRSLLVIGVEYRSRNDDLSSVITIARPEMFSVLPYPRKDPKAVLWT